MILVLISSLNLSLNEILSFSENAVGACVEPKAILENKDMLTLAACQLHINLYMLKGVGTGSKGEIHKNIDIMGLCSLPLQ